MDYVSNPNMFWQWQWDELRKEIGKQGADNNEQNNQKNRIMKKIVLISSIIFCCNLMTAQDTNNYQIMIHMIDSMKIEYSVKELINGPMVKRPYQYREPYKHLTEDYQNKVIDCISDLYNQEEYLGLYALASVLLDEYYDYSKEETRKRIIDIWFDKRCYSSFSVTSLGSSQDYSEKTKQRLLDIRATASKYIFSKKTHYLCIP